MIKKDAERITNRMAVLKAELETDAEKEPIFHQATADIYVREAQNLIGTLNGPNHRTQAAELLRGLISKITLTPTNGCDRLIVSLEGDLAGILSVAQGQMPFATGPTGSQFNVGSAKPLEPLTYCLPERTAQEVVGKAGCGSRI